MKASQFNIGFDIEMFQSRLTLNVDMFYQKTTDLLFKKPVKQVPDIPLYSLTSVRWRIKDLNWH